MAFQLNPDQTLYIGGLARMDFVKGERAGFITHFSNDLKIHRTKLEKANDLWKTHAGTLLAPVIKDEEQLRSLKRHAFNIKEEKIDIVISGLGFITVPGGSKGKEVYVHAPTGVGVFMRPSIF